MIAGVHWMVQFQGRSLALAFDTPITPWPIHGERLVGDAEGPPNGGGNGAR